MIGNVEEGVRGALPGALPGAPRIQRKHHLDRAWYCAKRRFPFRTIDLCYERWLVLFAEPYEAWR